MVFISLFVVKICWKFNTCFEALYKWRNLHFIFGRGFILVDECFEVIKLDKLLLLEEAYTLTLSISYLSSFNVDFLSIIHYN